MPQQPVADTARVVVTWTKGTEDFSNVYHFTKPGFVVADMDALAAAVGGAANSLTTGALSNDVAYAYTTVYDLRTSTGPVKVYTAGAAAGGISGEAVPINTAIVVTSYSAARGRSGRGRTYYTGFPVSNIVDGQWTAATETSIESHHGNIVGNALAQGWTAVIVSRRQNKAELADPITYEIVSWQVRDRKVGSQRRRVDRS